MRSRATLGFLALALVSAGVLAWTASGGSRGPRPVAPSPTMNALAWRGVAAAGFGRRVLVITARPGLARSGAILESEQVAGEWELFAAEPPGAAAMEDALLTLAQRAADTFDAARRAFPADVERALELFAVKAVLVDPVERGMDPQLVVLQDAEPVARVEGEVPAAAVTDPVRLAAALTTSQALFRDFDDALWGGELTVEAATPGRYVFPFAAEGAKVEVDGRAVSPERAGPLVVVALPAGRPRVAVTYDVGGRAWLPLLGAAGLVAGALGFLLGIRPSAAEIEAAENDGGPDERSGG